MLLDFSCISWVVLLVGVFIVILVVFVGMLFGYFYLLLLVIGIIVVVILVVVIGVFYEDGFSDVVDGFFGGYMVKCCLEIMKDSWIGVFGVLVLVLSIGLCVVLVGEFWCRFGIVDVVLIYFLVEVISCLILVW